VIVFIGQLSCRQTRHTYFLLVLTALRYVSRLMCVMSTVDFSVSCRTTRTRNVARHLSQFTRAKVLLTLFFFILGFLKCSCNHIVRFLFFSVNADFSSIWFRLLCLFVLLQIFSGSLPACLQLLTFHWYQCTFLKSKTFLCVLFFVVCLQLLLKHARRFWKLKSDDLVIA